MGSAPFCLPNPECLSFVGVGFSLLLKPNSLKFVAAFKQELAKAFVESDKDAQVLGLGLSGRFRGRP